MNPYAARLCAFAVLQREPPIGWWRLACWVVQEEGL